MHAAKGPRRRNRMPLTKALAFASGQCSDLRSAHQKAMRLDESLKAKFKTVVMRVLSQGFTKLLTFLQIMFMIVDNRRVGYPAYSGFMTL